MRELLRVAELSLFVILILFSFSIYSQASDETLQNIVDKYSNHSSRPNQQGRGQVRIIVSLDIIKAHGGEINVETKEGEGSEFIIQLPTKSSIP
jgi:signal transduction histidine kinase